MDILLTHKQIGSMVKRLRDACDGRLSHSQAHEGLAQALGHPNWDTLSGLLKREETGVPKLERPVQLYVSAHADDEFGESPGWLRTTLTEEFLSTVRQLQTLCASHKLESVEVYEAGEWENEEEFHLRGDKMHVDSRWFWYQAYPKHATYNVESSLLTIEELFEALSTGKGTNELVWHNNSTLVERVIQETLIARDILANEG